MAMEKPYKVYKHTTPSNKVYIGITSMPTAKRWKNGKGYECCTAFARAIQKYGWQNIAHEILADGLGKDEACEMEKSLIKHYQADDPAHGYNLTSGGEHYLATDAVKDKERLAQISYYESHPEARRAISERQKGRKASDNTRQKMSDARKQYLASHPQSVAPFVNAIKGKKRSNEFCNHLSEINKTRVLCEETGQVFESVEAAAAWVGVCRTSVSNALTGRSKTAAGYHFRKALVGGA